MSDQLFTMSGTKIFISSTPVASKGEVELSDFASTDWIEIRGLYEVGELGGEQTINEFELINEVWMRKSKGGRNGGTMSNVFIPYAGDAGQQKFKEAIENCRPYQFKVERGADCSPESTVTITVADPAVITWNNHGLFANQPVTFTTTGELPTGLTAGEIYYVLSDGLTDNSFSVSATEGGAPVETTVDGSGTHTAIAPPIGMTDMFQGYATDGTKSGGDKNALFTQTWPIAVDGRIITV